MSAPYLHFFYLFTKKQKKIYHITEKAFINPLSIQLLVKKYANRRSIRLTRQYRYD